MYEIKVNATSANLAVGFDVLGLALDINNIFRVERADAFSFIGFSEEYSNKDNNLFYRAYKSVFDYLNRDAIPIKIEIECNIPIERGLGSSASLIVGGVFAANEMLAESLKEDELLAICAGLEGHADNVAPAIFGGLTSVYRVADHYRPFVYKLANNLSYALLIPPYKISTEEARKILPEGVAYKDLSYSMGRLVALPKAMMFGDITLIKEILDDRIQEPYRARLIDGYHEIRKMCDQNNIAMAISGSGSSILLISDDPEGFKKIHYRGYRLLNVGIGNGVEIKEI